MARWKSEVVFGLDKLDEMMMALEGAGFDIHFVTFCGFQQAGSALDIRQSNQQVPIYTISAREMTPLIGGKPA